LDNSRTAFAMSNLECLTRYNNIPTPDLYFVWSVADIRTSPCCRLQMIDFGEAGVV
jgi:hypothetical protein